MAAQTPRPSHRGCPDLYEAPGPTDSGGLGPSSPFPRPQATVCPFPSPTMGGEGRWREAGDVDSPVSRLKTRGPGLRERSQGLGGPPRRDPWVGSEPLGRVVSGHRWVSAWGRGFGASRGCGRSPRAPIGPRASVPPRTDPAHPLKTPSPPPPSAASPPPLAVTLSYSGREPAGQAQSERRARGAQRRRPPAEPGPAGRRDVPQEGDVPPGDDVEHLVRGLRLPRRLPHRRGLLPPRARALPGGQRHAHLRRLGRGAHGHGAGHRGLPG